MLCAIAFALLVIVALQDPGSPFAQLSHFSPGGSTTAAAAGRHQLPSVFGGLTQTSNDLSVDDVINVSHEADALTHVKLERRPKHIDNVASGRCPDVIAQFDRMHTTVVEKHSEYLKSFVPPDKPPDLWCGHSPMCGIHTLYNLTGELYVMDEGSLPATVEAGVAHRVVLKRCSSGRVSPAELARYLRGDKEPQAAMCTDVYVSARLVGPSIVGTQVHRVEPSCDIALEFTVHDEGSYHLEVQLVWLNGLGPERSPPVHPVVLRKIHSKFGKKPHQRYTFNSACEGHTHVLGSPFDVSVVATSSRTPPAGELPVCTFGSGHQHGYGRWVRHANDHPCNASTAYCSGNPVLLNDAKPFNEDYVWAPYRCKVHHYNYKEGPAGPCVSKPGTMLLMGDSTTREYAQSLKLFDLRRTSLRVEYANWKLDWQYFSRSMAEKSVARLGNELRSSRPIVLVANLGPLHLIGGLRSDDWRFYVDQWVKLFQPGGPLDFLEKKVFLGPAAIHYATNDMTAQRMLNWMAYAYEKLSPLGFEYVAAWNMTEGRPESSWDGVHYSAERGKAQMKKLQRRRKVFKWNGGVSVMLTSLLLNMLCAPNY